MEPAARVEEKNPGWRGFSQSLRLLWAQPEADLGTGIGRSWGMPHRTHQNVANVPVHPEGMCHRYIL